MISIKIALKKLLLIAAAVAFGLALYEGTVFAQSCNGTYGGGTTCTVDRRFSVELRVRKKDHPGKEWLKKVADVERFETLQFRVRVKNLGNVEADRMKMTLYLPSEIIRTGGAGLTEYWDNFDPCDDDDSCREQRKDFIIEGKVLDSEFDVFETFEPVSTDKDLIGLSLIQTVYALSNFNKCVVVRTEVTRKTNFVGADVATVCYGNAEITELPNTGAESLVVLGLIGATLIGLGLYLRKRTA